MSKANGNGTAIAPVERNKTGQFVKGHGRVGGRKIGSRNKLSEAFPADLHKTWLRQGRRVLDKLAESEPTVFLRVCATVLPKAMEIDGVLNVQHQSTVHVEARDFLEAYERWGQHIGANMPRMIEAQVIEDETENTLENEDTGEFAGFDTIDAICAYVYHKEGEAGLRWVIGQVFDPNDLPECAYPGGGAKETLEDTAAELERRGLDKPAAIIRDIAKDFISGIYLPPDYMVRAGPQFVESWRRSWIQRRHIQLSTFDQYLRQKKADKARQSRTTTQKPASHKP